MMAGLLLCLTLTTIAQEINIDRRVLHRARDYEPQLRAAAARHGLDARLLWVIAYLESHFNPRAVSRKGARGLMQLLPATAARFGVSDPHDPTAAIEGAARYLRYLLQRFDGRVELALAAYNAGEAAVEAYRTGRTIQSGNRRINSARLMTGGIPPWPETRAYVTRGLRLLSHLNARLSAVPPATAPSFSADLPARAQKKSVVRLSITYQRR